MMKLHVFTRNKQNQLIIDYSNYKPATNILIKSNLNISRKDPSIRDENGISIKKKKRKSTQKRGNPLTPFKKHQIYIGSNLTLFVWANFSKKRGRFSFL